MISILVPDIHCDVGRLGVIVNKTDSETDRTIYFQLFAVTIFVGDCCTVSIDDGKCYVISGGRSSFELEAILALGLLSEEAESVCHF